MRACVRSLGPILAEAGRPRSSFKDHHRAHRGTEHTESSREIHCFRELSVLIAKAVCKGLAHLRVLCASVGSVVAFERAMLATEVRFGGAVRMGGDAHFTMEGRETARSE